MKQIMLLLTKAGGKELGQSKCLQLPGLTGKAHTLSCQQGEAMTPLLAADFNYMNSMQ